MLLIFTSVINCKQSFYLFDNTTLTQEKLPQGTRPRRPRGNTFTSILEEILLLLLRVNFLCFPLSERNNFYSSSLGEPTFTPHLVQNCFSLAPKKTCVLEVPNGTNFLFFPMTGTQKLLSSYFKTVIKIQLVENAV